MLLSRKLKNQIEKIKPTNLSLEYHLKNTNINGMKQGCFGFIKNLSNDKIVYVNTEKSCYAPLFDKNLYRTAESLKDYTGGYNRFAIDSELPKEIIELIK